MFYNIYKITKPNSNGIYIGRTKCDIKVRMCKHKSNKKSNNKLKIYQWFDNTCKIELIETTTNKNREFEIIKEYLDNPEWQVMNIYVGAGDVEEYRKKYYEKNLEKIKKYHKQEDILNKKNQYQKTSQHAKEYRTEYYKYHYQAKKLGITIEEYKKSLNNGN